MQRVARVRLRQQRLISYTRGLAGLRLTSSYMFLRSTFFIGWFRPWTGHGVAIAILYRRDIAVSGYKSTENACRIRRLIRLLRLGTELEGYECRDPSVVQKS